MQNNNFKLEIITPEEKFYDGEVENLIIETQNGKTEILKDHMEIVIGIIPAFLKITENGKEKSVFTSEGFLQVDHGEDKVHIFVQHAEWEDQMEENKIKKQIQTLERKLNQKESTIEYKTSKATISRLFEKLKNK